MELGPASNFTLENLADGAGLAKAAFLRGVSACRKSGAGHSLRFRHAAQVKRDTGTKLKRHSFGGRQCRGIFRLHAHT